MALYSSFETAEPGLAEDFLSHAYVELSLRLPDDHAGFRLASDRTDPGPFQFDKMTIGATASFAYEPEEELFATCVRAGTLRLRQAGVDEIFTPGEVALIGLPGVDSVTEVEDYRQDVITLDPASLREVAGLGPDDSLPRFTAVRPASPRRARTWLRALDLVGGMLQGDPAVADSPIVVGSAERMLAGLFLATFPNSGSGAEPSTRQDEHDARSPRTLRRAISFIDSNADLDIGIADVAHAADVSPRAVQLAFRRHHGTTPTAYLRRVRLDHAHHELLGATIGDGLTVTEVAYRWGFSSPSRFAERYRAVFGISPSQTLRS